MPNYYKEYRHWRNVAIIAMSMLASVIGAIIAAIVVKLLL